ncbi:MAG: NifB/NifX family molybdenum-iron cluster-binding protein [Deltaproteobacteria bacterium]|jgi:predicted Fe-Mo cluster-binding NifX family protein|nr:NifB/NifX family molybdenum-iron cluster-binding protein [Deltaproteobacteria bacterium]
MKVAIPSRDGRVDDHFGHCDYFSIFTVNDSKEVVAEEALQSPQGCGCKSGVAVDLAKKGVQVMLAGNMGEGAKNVLQNNGIQVIRGCSGDVKTVLASWLAGNLRDSGILCTSHECH